MLVNYFFLGIFLTILSGNEDTGFLSKCLGKNSVNEFKTCILQENIYFIRGINLESYKQTTFLTEKTSAEIIIPKNGSVGFRNLYKPTFNLDPLLVYRLCLYDKDFLLSISNPFIIPRTCVTVSANSSVMRIPVKVGMNVF